MFKLNVFYLMSIFIFSNQAKDEKKLIVSYSAIACTCAQWRVENIKTHENIYLERANENILDANTIWDGETLPLKLNVKGHYKKQMGIPKGYPTKGNPEPGRVFIYYQIEVIK